MKIKRLLSVAMLCTASAASAQQLLVFPAVTDEQPGQNGSLWVTTAMVVKADPRDEVTIRRKWVCLRGGGFVDDPATAPTWSLATNDPTDRLLFALGGEFLEGTDATVGAVALEVQGGEVLSHSNIMDIQKGEYSPSKKLAFGQGQHVAAFRAPLQGPSHIPWLGGCSGTWCSEDPPAYWQYLRNNIGIVNPNPEPLAVTGTVLPFGYYDPDVGLRVWAEWSSAPPEIFRKVVPAHGWIQFGWSALQNYSSQWSPFFPSAGFVISLTTDRDLPYYAYASVVFTPDPDSGAPEFNDPMFIPAEPGYIPPFTEGTSPP